MSATTGGETRPILEVEDVDAGFGVHAVLHGVRFSVREGELAALLGLNGAGKSVTLKTISGLLRPWAGRILLDGKDITGVEPEDRVKLGLAHVPQGRAVFPHLSVEANLRLGGATVKDKERYRAGLERVFERFPRLADRRTQLAGTLSGGEQGMLAVGRALMSHPRLILVDEPSAGLAPVAVAELLDTIKRVNDAGVSVLMVEQNTTFTLKIADTVHLMQKGVIVLSSPVQELSDPTELLRYLGVGELTSDRLRRIAAKRAGAALVEKPARKRPATGTRRAPAKKPGPKPQRSTRGGEGAPAKGAKPRTPMAKGNDTATPEASARKRPRIQRPPQS